MQPSDNRQDCEGARIADTGAGHAVAAVTSVTPATFEQLAAGLVDLRDVNAAFHVHIPKAGGGTVHALFRQNYWTPLDFNMNTCSFFDSVGEDAVNAALRSPKPRQSFYFTGHFRLDAGTLRAAQMPHVIVSTLRDPVQRVLSHYNFTLFVPGNPWHEQLRRNEMSFADYVIWLVGPNSVGPQYSFFDDTGAGSFAYTGHASVERCLDNLLSRVAVYGFSDRFDEFCVQFGFLLRLQNISTRTANESRLLKDKTIQSKTELTEAERRFMTDVLADDIWFYDQARRHYAHRLAHPRLAKVMEQALPHVTKARTALEAIVRIRDPGNDNCAAFSP